MTIKWLNEKIPDFTCLKPCNLYSFTETKYHDSKK